MRLVIDVLQLLFHKLGIDLRRGDIRMAEHFLDRMDIGAVFQKMCGKGMAQRMRRDVLIDVRLLLI